MRASESRIQMVCYAWNKYANNYPRLTGMNNSKVFHRWYTNYVNQERIEKARKAIKIITQLALSGEITLREVRKRENEK